MSYNDSGKYMLRVKADTNSCPFENDEHLRDANELNRWRENFLQNPPFDISPWTTVNRDGKQSISVIKLECNDLDHMTDFLLDSIDGVESSDGTESNKVMPFQHPRVENSCIDKTPISRGYPEGLMNRKSSYVVSTFIGLYGRQWSRIHHRQSCRGRHRKG